MSVKKKRPGSTSIRRADDDRGHIAVERRPEPATRRPFTGYDRERAAYARLKPDLLSRAAGKYVVIVGDDLVGPVETFGDALEAGFRRFGLGPLFVRQILAVDPVAETSRDS